MKKPALTTIEPLLTDLEARIARRDAPPEAADPHRFAPERVRQRLADYLQPLVPDRNARGRDSQALMLFAFLQQDSLSAAALAAAAGLGRIAGSHAHSSLLRAGLLTWTQAGPRRQFRLTRWGEDWLLAVARCEVPPVRPEAEPTDT